MRWLDGRARGWFRVTAAPPMIGARRGPHGRPRTAGAQRLAAAGAQQPGQSHHLAWPDGQIDRVDRALASRPHRREERPVRLRRGRGRALVQGLHVFEVLADHVADELQAGQVRGLVLADQPAVAQHGDAVGHRVHLLQEVGDEHDAHALAAQLAHDGEEFLHSCSSRLEVGSSRMSTFAEMSRARASATICWMAMEQEESWRETSMSTSSRARAARARSRMRPQRIAPEARRLAAQADVLRHREVRDEVDLLVDRADAAGLGLAREAGRMACPASASRRRRAGRRPVSTLISVLLPAPFSPISAWISPERTVKSTPDSACTPGNPFVRPENLQQRGVHGRGGAEPESVLAVRQGLGGLGLVVHAFVHADASAWAAFRRP
jgi:hypothetical protein